MKNGKPIILADARIAGKGERKFFATRTEAETWAQIQRTKRTNDGVGAFGDPELARYGKTVRDAIAFYLDHLRREEASVNIPSAVTELVATKIRAGKSEQYGKDLTNRLRRLSDEFPDRTLAQLTTADLDRFLQSLPVAPGTKNTFRRDVRTLWGFAGKRGWADPMVARNTESATVDTDAPGILTPDKAAALVAAFTTTFSLPFMPSDFSPGCGWRRFASSIGGTWTSKADSFTYRPERRKLVPADSSRSSTPSAIG